MDFSDPVNTLPNTSYVTVRRLKSIGIHTNWDLINYFPFRYEDYSIISPISRIQEGETVTVQGTVSDSKNIFTRSGLRIQKIVLRDATGSIELNWFNQPYLIQLLHPGTLLSASGTAKRIGKKLTLMPENYEVLSLRNQTKHTGRIVPVYSEKKGLSSKTIREKIWTVLQSETESIPEFLPSDIIAMNNLISEKTAYHEIHFPDTDLSIEEAKKRLSFDELFCIQLASQLVRATWDKEIVGNRCVIDSAVQKKIDLFMQKIPFSLTAAQKKAVSEILADIGKKQPMNRFLQGEVGSGKTVVAAIAAYAVFLNGYTTLFMAPTEILAEQHFKTFTQLFDDTDVRTVLVTGSKKPSAKEIAQADIIIGTHAIIHGKHPFDHVGLVIIDEQHRFGVSQRAELKKKARLPTGGDVNPHLLTMTATPIPRTVMLTIYGELDISILDEIPKGRVPIKTYVVPPQKRQSCYEWIQKQILIKHMQAYIICPLIEESATETLKSVKAVKKEYEHLSKDVFKKVRVGLLHGRLPAKEKNKVMEAFTNRAYDILVATPVVEVGIDVPSATIMIIEGAERFGLSQLHQLRGRIGRGKRQSYCFVFNEREDPTVSKRLSFFTKTLSGNELAQKDLEMRGPGNLYGIEQHGFLDLKIALFSDYPLIEQTKKAVGYFLRKYSIDEFPELSKRVDDLNTKEIARD